MRPVSRRDPRSLGPFTPLVRLADGGMGTVYLATARAARGTAADLFAVKTLQDRFLDPRGLRRFQREVERTRAIDSPYVVRVVDAGVYDAVPWYAMEYLADALPLTRLVQCAGPLGRARVLDVARDLARGLVALHTAGVVHCDLKPDNVLVAGDVVKLIDLGIARALDERSSTLIGSPGWTAPEQSSAEGSEPSRDIYAWGLVTAYMALGRNAKDGGEPLDLGGVDNDLRALIEQALAPDPRDRPSAHELVVECELLVPGPTVVVADATRVRVAVSAPVRTVEPEVRVAGVRDLLRAGATVVVPRGSGTDPAYRVRDGFLRIPAGAGVDLRAIPSERCTVVAAREGTLIVPDDLRLDRPHDDPPAATSDVLEQLRRAYSVSRMDVGSLFWVADEEGNGEFVASTTTVRREHHAADRRDPVVTVLWLERGQLLAGWSAARIAAEYPNHGQPWASRSHAHLRSLALEGHSLHRMTKALGRSPHAVCAALRELGLARRAYPRTAPSATPADLPSVALGGVLC